MFFLFFFFSFYRFEACPNFKNHFYYYVLIDYYENLVYLCDFSICYIPKKKMEFHVTSWEIISLLLNGIETQTWNLLIFKTLCDMIKNSNILCYLICIHVTIILSNRVFICMVSRDREHTSNDTKLMKFFATKRYDLSIDE